MSEWIDIKEKLPEISVNVLIATRYGVFYASRQHNLKADGSLDVGYLYWWSPGPRYFSADDVTHWMLLPEAPRV